MTMTPRERMAALFGGARTDRPAVCLHMWGRYPFEVFGKEALWDKGRVPGYADVYADFMRRFPCDWYHVCEGHPWRGGLPSPPPADGFTPEMTREAVDRWVDGNFDGQTISREDAVASGIYDHVRALRDRDGDRAMVVPNSGAPGGGFPWLGWEDQMILVQQDQDLVAHYVERDCQRFLERVLAAGDQGADGYIFSEGYGGACDLSSPACYEKVFLGPKQTFYRQVRDAGLLGIGYFLGGILPFIDLINEVGVDGVLIEESKKTFHLDPVEIRKRLDPRVVLFGNVDSYLLLTGPSNAIREAVARQAEARAHGPFVHANGSPLCPGTPREHIEAFLEAATMNG